MAYTGSPRVMICTCSKVLNASTIVVINTKNATGRTIGSVILKSRVISPAPSTVAASYSSTGIELMPAR